MGRTIICLSGLLLLAVFSSIPNVSADLTCPCNDLTITFDDVSVGPISNGYQGFDWTNFGVLDGDTYVESGYVNGVVSHPNVAYNGFGNPAELHVTSPSQESDFALITADLTGAWDNDLTITITGNDNGKQVASYSVTVNSASPTTVLFPTTFGSVDDIVFTCSGGTNAGFSEAPATGSGSQFALDNLVLGCPRGIQQDPQFVGLQGQSFQIHGLADSVFNLISTPHMQLNSRFVYLSNGKCFYNDTACWSHPGTYLQSLGFQFYEQRLEIRSSSHDAGLSVYLNNQLLEPSSSPSTVRTVLNKDAQAVVTYPIKNRLIFENDIWQLVVTNADFFVNIQVSLLDSDLMRTGRTPVQFRGVHPETVEGKGVHIHGLVGQTWRNAQYAKGQKYEGEVLDYWIESNDLFGSGFMYNQFQH